MSRIKSRSEFVFLILPDNTALQLKTLRTQSQRSVGASLGRRTVIDVFKLFAPRIARVTPEAGAPPSGSRLCSSHPLRSINADAAFTGGLYGDSIH